MGDGDTPLFNLGKIVDCSGGWEDPKCRAYLISRQEAPSLPTEDIINPRPDTLQPTFSKDSWGYYWSQRFGDTGRRVGGYVFRALDSRDRIRPNDGYFDLSTVTADELDRAVGQLGMRKEDGSEDTEAIEAIGEMREVLRQYRSSYLRVHYLAESENGQLVAVDENWNVAGFYGGALDKVWGSIRARYPDAQVARLIVDRQTFAGNDESIGLNSERSGGYEPLLYAGALAATGGLGVFPETRISNIEIRDKHEIQMTEILNTALGEMEGLERERAKDILLACSHTPIGWAVLSPGRWILR